MRPIAPIAVLLAIAALAAGCGGGGNDNSAGGGETTGGGPTVTTSSLTRAEFDKQATAICHREREDFLSQVASYMSKHEGSKSSTEVFADAVRALLLPTIETELAKIRELGAPAGDEAQVKAILDAEQEAVDEVAKLKSISSRFQIERYFADAARLAQAYGIPDCGNDTVVTG